MNLISNSTGGCFLIEKFFSEKISNDYFAEIISACSFETKYMPINGKLIGMPRKISYFGNKDYTYSGVKHSKQPFPEFISKILQTLCESELLTKRIKKESLKSLNSCLINYYENENDYISFHSDDEKELGPDNKTNILIVSVSFGCEREFVIKNKKSELKISLQNGSVLIMYGDFQQHYVHSLIKGKTKCDGRINLTFRVIL